MQILIDASNAWYRAYCSTFLDPPGGPVLIFTYMLRRVCNDYGKNNVTVVWDGGGSSGRKELDETYKADRKAVEGVWEDIVYAKSMVNYLGLANAVAVGFEADDVLGSLASKSPDPSLILSYDKDFYQLVNGKIGILRPERTVKGNKIPQQIIDRDAVIEEFGCPPEKVVLYKSFRGDASDNIPKISIRFTKNFSETFYRVLLGSSNLEDFYSKINDFDPKYREELLQFKERAKLNEQILKIKTELDIQVDRPKLDPPAFETLCKELEITKLKISDWESMITEAPPPAPIQNTLF